MNQPPVKDSAAVQTAAESPRVYRQKVGSFVAQRVAMLIKTRETSATTALLAKLRKNIAQAPGSDSDIWAVTIAGVPGSPYGDKATNQEWAVHIAVTLFALHQQGKGNPSHVAGVGLGQAVARLDRLIGGPEEGVSPVRRRFNAIVTSQDITELRHHLRGLVSQLRGADIPLDYGMLADDLLAFQDPNRADDVRRRWARQFYHLDTNTNPSKTTQKEDK
jgi:CRISPR system Cascade subunit CasB